MKVIAETYGVLAEFPDGETLVDAAQQTFDAGYRRIDAFSGYPVEGLADAIGFRRTRLPLLVCIGGIIGGCVGFGLQYWVSVIEYPLNIGGRPLNSWPSFIPVTFELTILFSALTAVLGMLALNKLPEPWHPLFNVPRFQKYAHDGFFLLVQADDPLFHPETTRQFLERLNPIGLYEVPTEVRGTELIAEGDDA